jgi:hypothetical protein
MRVCAVVIHGLTCAYVLQDLWHAAILVTILMGFFAGIGQWRFGDSRSDFASFSAAMSTEFMMMFGKFCFIPSLFILVSTSSYLSTCCRRISAEVERNSGAATLHHRLLLRHLRVRSKLPLSHHCGRYVCNFSVIAGGTHLLHFQWP